MTINDKLRHFYEITIAEAEKKANAGLDEHKKMLKEKINEHKRTMYRNAEAEVRSETEHASKEINIALANEKLTLRRLLSSRQTELEDRLFQEVMEKLEFFMSTPQYDDYLVKKINEAIEFAGEDNLYIFISEGDAGRLTSLIERTGFPLQVSDTSFIGGIQARIPERNILIDDSFQGALETLRREFVLKGGD